MYEHDYELDSLYPNEHRELVEKFGLEPGIAEDLLASRNAKEIETVMVFLRRYGYMVNCK